MITADGLTVDEQMLVNRLSSQLDSHRRKNELRKAYMECRHIPIPPPTVPSYLRNIGLVLGWPAKAVEGLARWVRLDGMSIPGASLADFGLDRVLLDNEYFAQARMAHLSAFEQGVSWIVLSAGRTSEGEPPVLVTRQSALDGTGDWDERARKLTSFLSINSRGENGSVSEFVLYEPGQIVTVSDGEVAYRSPWEFPRLPVEPLIYRQRDTRPFGSSRITRPIRKLTDSAVRALMRSEGTADFYSSPLLALFGPDEQVFANTSPMHMLLSSIFTIPDNDDSEQPRADLKQLQQASQQPHISQLQQWAQLFAAEACIPVTSLGVGLQQANPTAADSYSASQEEMFREAGDAQDGFGLAHVHVMQDAWMMENNSADLPEELLRLAPRWHDPKGSKSVDADWLTKVASVFPWISQTDTALELMGLDEDTVNRLKAEHAQALARASLAALAAPNTQNGGA